MGVVYPFLETDEDTCMRKALEKLNSDRGASLMLALLAFLICAVLGSVVLTAGTASSGRFAELGNMEQRYYAVTSAAELLRRDLCAQSGTKVECSKVSTMKTVTAYTVDEDGVFHPGAVSGPELDPSVSPNPLYTFPAAPANLSEQLAQYLTFGADGPADDVKWNRFIGTAAVPSFNVPDMTLTVTPEGGSPDAGLAVNVKSTMNADGTLTLEISNDKDKAKTQYTLKMTLTPSIDRQAEPLEEQNRQVVTTAAEIVETINSKETRTATVRWVVSTIQTVEGTPSPSPTI